MLTKFMVLLVAGSALTGCCVSGTGCATQTAGAPIAWRIKTPALNVLFTDQLPD
jgi:hypothetical protein